MPPEPHELLAAEFAGEERRRDYRNKIDGLVERLGEPCLPDITRVQIVTILKDLHVAVTKREAQLALQACADARQQAFIMLVIRVGIAEEGHIARRHQDGSTQGRIRKSEPGETQLFQT